MENKTDIDTKTLDNNVSDGSELIPSDVAARIEREGTQKEKRQEIQENDAPTTGGYTVDQEGLINNYPVTPPMTGAKYPTPREQYAYIILGGLAAAFVISLICIAFSVS
ncbi:MAG: ssl1498 family light-harvesting-like protein [Crocosphaera sp.]|nr:ssl1498 family light-harvesting-like protein [Crocosphaera sp.]